MKFWISAALLMTTAQVLAGGPQCDGPGELSVSWPQDNPIWEFCYLAPSDSSAVRGSSLEIRDAYLSGKLVFERAHLPMLFATYTDGVCYRDWMDTDTDFLRSDLNLNPPRPTITTCDASVSETQAVGDCPFQDVSPGGSGSVGINADCITGVDVERHDDHVLLTSNHSAAWYKYSARFAFYADGRIEPEFGFGNSSGTRGHLTHWHNGYWRINFDIDGPENDEVFEEGVQMTTEFSGFRDPTAGTGGSQRTWSIVDSETQRGYRVVPTAREYNTATNASGSGQHTVDVMATIYKIDPDAMVPEYSDTPGQWNISNCVMDHSELVNGESLVDVNQAGVDVVFWYRTAVTDLSNAGMVCKTGGPILEPIGDWGIGVLFEDGFE